MQKKEKIELFGVTFDNLTLREAVECALCSDTRPCFVVTPNAVMMDACRRNEEYARLLRGATLSLADGKGVLLLARRNRTPLCERVSGIDFAEALLARAAHDGLRVFLLGGAYGVAELAAERLRTRFPTLCICGTHHGYFDFGGTEEQRVLDEISQSRPDLLFVCMGFPRQEEWIATHLASLTGVRVAVGLGGSLDVWAGRVKRAPRFLSHIGLEWAWRMVLQPKRLCQLPTLIRVAVVSPKSMKYRTRKTEKMK